MIPRSLLPPLLLPCLVCSGPNLRARAAIQLPTSSSLTWASAAAENSLVCGTRDLHVSLWLPVAALSTWNACVYIRDTASSLALVAFVRGTGVSRCRMFWRGSWRNCREKTEGKEKNLRSFLLSLSPLWSRLCFSRTYSHSFSLFLFLSRSVSQPFRSPGYMWPVWCSGMMNSCTVLKIASWNMHQRLVFSSSISLSVLLAVRRSVGSRGQGCAFFVSTFFEAPCFLRRFSDAAAGFYYFPAFSCFSFSAVLIGVRHRC